MKIQILSDLHSEFYESTPSTPRFFLSKLEVAADVLVLAGDAFAASRSRPQKDAFREAIETISKKWTEVVFVAGNHEFYCSSWQETVDNLRAAAAECPNFNLLDDVTRELIIDDQRFVGGTLWFSRKPDTSLNDEHAINDFRAISGFRDSIYAANALLDEWLWRYLRAGDVVVTHHLPSHRSIQPEYVGSRLNRFFVHEMSDLILERCPKLWVHGHTHSSCNYMIGDTSVVANPYGYYGENKRFRPALVLDV